VRRWTAYSHIGSDPWRALSDELDEWAQASAVLWWRDDDAVAATSSLDMLLAIQADHAVPLAVASVPVAVDASLVRALEHTAVVRVLAHGWDHRNHAPPGMPRAELDRGRAQSDILTQLAAGRQRLADLFGLQFLPVLVPPFNRIDPALLPIVRQAGLTALSVDGDFTLLPMQNNNVHVDVCDWHTGTAIDATDAVRRLIGALRLRRLGLVKRSAPIGLLTHHLVHDAAGWRLIRALLSHLVAHKSVAFLPIERIFTV
jgi:peptidoglycan/xylan/chitin deacetylase (PgdA/CDA1 family)